MELATATPAANAPHAVAGTHNLRDTGGYSALTGETRWGKLYRSDALHLVTDQGLESLRALGLGHIIDLRDDAELASSPSRLDGVSAVVHHSPIFRRPLGELLGETLGELLGETVDASATPHLQGLTLSSLYRMMLEDFALHLVAAIRLIADSGTEPVLVHCTAGKDRTGMVVALALLSVGVARGAVVADYAATEENLRGEWSASMLQKMLDSGLELSSELTQIVSASPAVVMEQIIDEIENTFGSAADFLLANGLTEDELTNLRFVLIEPLIEPQLVEPQLITLTKENLS